MRLLKDESGSPSAEYVLLLTLLGVAAIAGLSALGQAVKALFELLHF
jgi:Flp pilus assembly pilin Flp